MAVSVALVGLRYAAIAASAARDAVRMTKRLRLDDDLRTLVRCLFELRSATTIFNSMPSDDPPEWRPTEVRDRYRLARNELAALIAIGPDWPSEVSAPLQAIMYGPVPRDADFDLEHYEELNKSVLDWLGRFRDSIRQTDEVPHPPPANDQL